MFQRILVPLDGSSLAEAILGPSRYLVERTKGTLILFHVIEAKAPASVHGESHLTAPDEARAYLDHLADDLRRWGDTVETDLHAIQEADVAHTIVQHAAELRADLTALCAHGRGGLRDLLIGSIPQQVIQAGITPVLFVGNPDQEKEPQTGRQVNWQKILLPLDGAAVHEGALPLAAAVARITGASLELVRVVPTGGTLSPERAAVGMLLPSTTEAVLDLTQRQATEYLRTIVARLEGDELSSHGSVRRGDAATEIVQAAQDTHSDLIVLATHARDNWDAFWSGSVTPPVLSHAKVPVLLVRVTGEESAR